MFSAEIATYSHIAVSQPKIKDQVDQNCAVKGHVTSTFTPHHNNEFTICTTIYTTTKFVFYFQSPIISGSNTAFS